MQDRQPKRVHRSSPCWLTSIVSIYEPSQGMAALFMSMRGYSNVANLSGGLVDLGMA